MTRIASRLPDTKLLVEDWVVLRNVDGGGWEAAVHTSLLTVLVFAIGLAHLSSPEKFQQWSVARDEPGSPRVSDVMLEMSSDRTYQSVNSNAPTNCPFVSSDEILKQTCPATVLSCERSLAEYQTMAAVSRLGINIETPRAWPSARPTLAHCTESIAVNSSKIDSGASASVCS